MGFAIDFLIYAPDKKSPALAGFGEGKHKVHGFRNRKELRSKIESLSCSAFYSDSFFDTRLSRSGKPQFSLEFFEAGLEGSVRSLERLLGVCRMPFYQRYGRYISAGAA